MPTRIFWCLVLCAGVVYLPTIGEKLFCLVCLIVLLSSYLKK